MVSRTTRIESHTSLAWHCPESSGAQQSRRAILALRGHLHAISICSAGCRWRRWIMLRALCTRVEPPRDKNCLEPLSCQQFRVRNPPCLPVGPRRLAKLHSIHHHQKTDDIYGVLLCDYKFESLDRGLRFHPSISCGMEYLKICHHASNKNILEPPH